jgi:hypothetical protein
VSIKDELDRSVGTHDLPEREKSVSDSVYDNDSHSLFANKRALIEIYRASAAAQIRVVDVNKVPKCPITGVGRASESYLCINKSVGVLPFVKLVGKQDSLGDKYQFELQSLWLSP